MVASAKTTDSKYEDVQYGWFTGFDVYAQKGAYHSPEAKEYCEALLKGASRSRPHIEKQYRKDTRFRQFWLLKSAIEGSSRRNDKSEGYELKGDVDGDAQERAAVAEALDSSFAASGLPTLPVPSGRWPTADEENDVGQEPVQEKTKEEQQQDNVRLQKVYADLSEVRRVIKELEDKRPKYITDLVQDLQAKQDRLQAAHAAMSSSSAGQDTFAFDAAWDDVKTLCNPKTPDCLAAALLEAYNRLGGGKVKPKPYVSKWDKQVKFD